MQRRTLVLGLALGIAAGVSATETGAQVTVRPPSDPATKADFEAVQKQQSVIDYFSHDIRTSKAKGLAAAARGDCGKLSEHREHLGNLNLWKIKGVPPENSAELMAQVHDAYSALWAVGCPPRKPEIAIGVNATGLNGIEIANGGLGGKRNAQGARIEVEAQPRSETWIMAFGQWGTISQEDLGAFGTSPTARTFLQPNGGTQVVPGAAAGTGGRTEGNVRHFGLGAEIGLGTPRALAPNVTVLPVVGFGVEYLYQDTSLRADWNGINFVILDQHEIETIRARVTGGARFEVRILSGTTFYLRAIGALNTDFVDGVGTYSTSQTGVFSETVRGTTSRTDVTFGGQVRAGLSRTFANGVTISVHGSVGSEPRWQLVYAENQPARVLDRQFLATDFGINANFRF